MAAFDCILFDLDGTLIDSRQDIADGVNAALSHFDRAPLSLETVQGFIGKGMKNLIQKINDVYPGIDFSQLFQAFRREYAQRLLVHTQLIEGIADMLEALHHKKGVDLGVMTNKSEMFTTPILEGFGLQKYFTWVVSGDTYPERKPHPAMLQAVANYQQRKVLMVGDSPVDIEFAKAGGIKSCGVSFGFHGEEDLSVEKPDFLVTSVGALHELLMA